MAITFFNNWKTLKEWHLIEISFSVWTDNIDGVNQFGILLAFFGFGVCIVFNI